MYLCTSIPVYLCISVPMHLCTYVPMFLCSYIPMSLCSYVLLHLCTYVPLRHYSYAVIPIYAVTLSYTSRSSAGPPVISNFSWASSAPKWPTITARVAALQGQGGSCALSQWSANHLSNNTPSFAAQLHASSSHG
jgi:hypothetical protein